MGGNDVNEEERYCHEREKDYAAALAGGISGFVHRPARDLSFARVFRETVRRRVYIHLAETEPTARVCTAGKRAEAARHLAGRGVRGLYPATDRGLRDF
jgi:hypothetical protein